MGCSPEITKNGIDMQVCVPSEWTDEQVAEFANSCNPSGTEAGWAIRKEGSKFLAGCPERVPCQDRNEMVHIMLDC